MDQAKHGKLEKTLNRSPLRQLKDGQLVFREDAQEDAAPSTQDRVAVIKDRLKAIGPLYYPLLTLFKPTLSSRSFKRQLHQVLAAHDESSFIINIGAGPKYTQGRRDVVNVDMKAFRETDIVCDATDIPLVDDCVDMVINISLLEHVPEPEKVIAEIHRILKPGGVAFCYVPFLQPFHAAPSDYGRWTLSGAQRLFKAFNVVNSGVGAGPTAGMLWVLQEWLALVCSCGITWLRPFFLLPVMALTAPLKLLDKVLNEVPGAEVLASGFFVLAEKRRA